MIRTAIKRARRLPQAHPTLCNSTTWSFWPTPGSDLKLPTKIVLVSVVCAVEGRGEGLCFLLTIFDENYKALAKTCETTNKRERKIGAVYEMPGRNHGCEMEMQRVALQDVRCIRIGQCRINRVKIREQFDVSDFV